MSGGIGGWLQGSAGQKKPPTGRTPPEGVSAMRRLDTDPHGALTSREAFPSQRSSCKGYCHTDRPTRKPWGFTLLHLFICHTAAWMSRPAEYFLIIIIIYQCLFIIRRGKRAADSPKTATYEATCVHRNTAKSIKGPGVMPGCLVHAEPSTCGVPGRRHGDGRKRAAGRDPAGRPPQDRMRTDAVPASLITPWATRPWASTNRRWMGRT